MLIENWIGWFVVVGALGGFIVACLRAWRVVGDHRSDVIQRATVSALGDGERVVLSFDASGLYPYRLAASGLVWGFSSWHSLTQWLEHEGAEFLGEREKWSKRQAFAPDAVGVGVCLSHPAMIRQTRHKLPPDRLDLSGGFVF